jgi:uncharacterized protein
MSEIGSNPDAHPTVTCATCAACCCRLEVLLMGDDDVPKRFTAEDPWGGWVMRRRDDGWCAALDRNTMLCTIYERRPGICRDYQMGDSDCIEERSRHLGSHPEGTVKAVPLRRFV